MAGASPCDKELKSLLEKISKENGAEPMLPKNPSGKATAKDLGANVSLVRNVTVPPIIVFNCHYLLSF